MQLSRRTFLLGSAAVAAGAALPAMLPSTPPYVGVDIGREMDDLTVAYLRDSFATNNPAWVFRDWMMQSGEGHRIDRGFLQDFANYCDELVPA